MPSFQEGEIITGQTSGETAIVGDLRNPPLVVTPSGNFLDNEWVEGTISSATWQLAASNHLMGPGAVDVSVSNENGQRTIGGTLVGAFTYV